MKSGKCALIAVCSLFMMPSQAMLRSIVSPGSLKAMVAATQAAKRSYCLGSKKFDRDGFDRAVRDVTRSVPLNIRDIAKQTEAALKVQDINSMKFVLDILDREQLVVRTMSQNIIKNMKDREYLAAQMEDEEHLGYLVACLNKHAAVWEELIEARRTVEEQIEKMEKSKIEQEGESKKDTDAKKVEKRLENLVLEN